VTWERASRIDWGTLLLLGGGFSLSHLVFETGLAAAIGDGVLGGRGLAAGGVGLLVLATALVLYLTELSSNTATISMMLPVILPIALRGGVDPVPVALCTTFAASFAFMLPVSTPPNAIVYGSGRVRLGTMIRYGSWMNILALAYLVLLGLSVLARLPLSAR
jgi:sodium-dependent dicarboxylate transporter 2/3/5